MVKTQRKEMALGEGIELLSYYPFGVTNLFRDLNFVLWQQGIRNDLHAKCKGRL